MLRPSAGCCCERIRLRLQEVDDDDSELDSTGFYFFSPPEEDLPCLFVCWWSDESDWSEEKDEEADD